MNLPAISLLVRPLRHSHVICPGLFCFSIVEVRFLLRRQAEGLVGVALEVLSQDLQQLLLPGYLSLCGTDL